MTDRDALFQAILAAPDDDLPRAVLADLLEEHGDADRAAYIRNQVELAKLVAREEYDSDEYVALIQAVGAVPNETLRGWVLSHGLPMDRKDGLLTRDTVGDLDRVRDVTLDLAYGFRRGFPEQVACKLTSWLVLAVRFRPLADLRRVELTDVRPYRLNSREWAWRSVQAGVGDRYNFLPADVFDYLPGRAADVAVYRNQRHALDALSAACLTFARRAR